MFSLYNESKLDSKIERSEVIKTHTYPYPLKILRYSEFVVRSRSEYHGLYLPLKSNKNNWNFIPNRICKIKFILSNWIDPQNFWICRLKFFGISAFQEIWRGKDDSLLKRKLGKKSNLHFCCSAFILRCFSTICCLLLGSLAKIITCNSYLIHLSCHCYPGLASPSKAEGSSSPCCAQCCTQEWAACCCTNWGISTILFLNLLSVSSSSYSDSAYFSGINSHPIKR